MGRALEQKHEILSFLEGRGLLYRFSVIPLNGKKPIEGEWQRWCCQKRPIDDNGFFNSDRSERNVGICCGPASGVLVIDVDHPTRFESVLATQDWDLPETFTVQTGGGGIHYYFAYPEDGKEYGNKSCKEMGFDVRGVGGQVVAPGSIHPGTKEPYRILRNGPFANPPGWLLNLYKPKKSIKPLRKEGEEEPEIDDLMIIDRLQKSEKYKKLWEGDWEDYFSQSEADLALCGELAKLTRNDPEKIDRIFRQSGLFRKKWMDRHSSEGKTYGEITIDKAFQERVSNVDVKGDFTNTDVGNAKRLVARHGDDIRYCYDFRKWIVWDGTRWVMDPGEMIVQRSKETVRHIYAEAKLLDSEELRKAVAMHAMKSESQQRISAMMKLAESEKGVQIKPEGFDKNPYLLNTLSGTINLKTMELLPHQREHYITRIAPIELDPSKDLLEQDHCPTWRSVLRRIFDRNSNLIAFFKRAVGYALSGVTTEQCFFFLYGLGANGKTTVLETIRAVMGEYGLQTDFSTFVSSNKSGVRNDIARMRGARFVSAVEADAGEHLHETLVKQATGGDRISARFLYEEFFEFEPQFKVFLVANHKPVIQGTDHAIWRRIKLIPFNVTIPEEEQDHQLREKLKEELPGILSWALQGCLEWRLQGLGVPQEVKAATSAYREEMDHIGGFLGDCCDIIPGGRSTAQELYERYSSWCIETGEDPVSSQTFGRKLSERGLTKRRGHRGVRCWTGIRLRDQEDHGPCPSPQVVDDEEEDLEPCNREVSVEDFINDSNV